MRKPDSKIMPPLVKKTREKHKNKIIKHREFKPIHKAWNTRMNKNDYKSQRDCEFNDKEIKLIIIEVFCRAKIFIF